MFHTKDPECSGCKTKLMGVHVAMVTWFWDMKKTYPTIHVCWGYRGEDEQHQDYLKGKSDLDWPHSKHNFMLNETPCSKALDIFAIGEDGQAVFPISLYEEIATKSINEGYHIRWGGTFVHLKDMDHWELVDD